MAKRGYLFGMIPFGPRFGNYLVRNDFRRPWRWLITIRSDHNDRTMTPGGPLCEAFVDDGKTLRCARCGNYRVPHSNG